MHFFRKMAAAFPYPVGISRKSGDDGHNILWSSGKEVFHSFNIWDVEKFFRNCTEKGGISGFLRLFPGNRRLIRWKTGNRGRWNVYNPVESVENVYFFAGLYNL